MSKIKTITVSNAKAIADFTADFNGMTAILTAGNNKGKTTFLRSLFDRIRGVKPDTILRTGTEQGFIEHVLTTGEKLRWEFKADGKEKLTYTTEKNIKTALTTELRTKFLPDTFDVDQFLQDAPMKQRKTLQNLAGLDFTDIDKRYQAAYEERTNTNRAYNEAKIKFDSQVVPEKVEAVDLSLLLMEKEIIKKELNDLYLANKLQNAEARKTWDGIKLRIWDEVNEHNQKQVENRLSYNTVYDASQVLATAGFISNDLSSFVEIKKLDILEDKVAADLYPDEPTYIEEMPDRTKLDTKDAEINAANETNRKAGLYDAWVLQKTALADALKASQDSNSKVSAIEQERLDLIKTANMPEGFTFSDDGILYNDMPFTREQLSSSGIYIGALKLASLKLGEIRCLHFDASFLDKESLLQIEAWAHSQDLQLLIEKPSWEPEELTYILIQE